VAFPVVTTAARWSDEAWPRARVSVIGMRTDSHLTGYPYA
jgi:hypothetical protein